MGMPVLTAVRARMAMARRPVTRSADVESGAMVALVPSAADAARLAVDGGEPAAQLHLTLVYLGDAVGYPPYVRELLYGIVAAEAEDLGPVVADGFSVSLFNPGSEDTCIVLGLSGGDLGAVHDSVTEKVSQAFALVDLVTPEQHEPFVPHVTIAYGDDPAVIKAVAGKTGPVTFDRLRLAFAGDVIDIPLGSPTERAEWAAIDDDELDEETLALIEALSRFDGNSSRAWDPAKHPRTPKGKPGGGRFLSLTDRIESAINGHHEGHSGDPFEGFSREQLRKAAKAHGIDLKRGASRDEISKALLDHAAPKTPQLPTAVGKVTKIKKATPGRVATKPRSFDHGDNFDEWGDAYGRSDELSQAQHDALHWYSGSGDEVINGVLRNRPKGDAQEQERGKESVALLDAVMRPAPEDIVVHRGQGLSAFGGKPPTVGQVFADPGFLSTTLDPESDFLADGAVNMRLTVPRGTPSYYLDGTSQTPDEYELLLARGAQLRIKSVTFNPGGRKWNPGNTDQWLVDAELVLPDGK